MIRAANDVLHYYGIVHPTAEQKVLVTKARVEAMRKEWEEQQAAHRMTSWQSLLGAFLPSMISTYACIKGIAEANKAAKDAAP